LTLSDTILQEFQNTLTRFKEDENKWENHTKAEYIKKCDELVTAQIENNIINIETEGISAYLFKKLTDFGIKVSEKTIQRNVPETHRRKYIKSDTLSDIEESVFLEVETEDPTIKIEKSQYNEIKINGTEYQAKPKPKEPKEIIGDAIIEEAKKQLETDQIKYIRAMSKMANKFHLTLDSLIDRYNESEESQKIIDKELGDVETKLKQYAVEWAKLENAKGMIDLRRDWGEYEKIMGTFMMNTGETIARIAQIMDYSEKYGSIGMLREKKIKDFFESETSYPLYLRSCPKCFVDISQIMNENISYYRECQEQGIEFIPKKIDIPVIKYI
jgi:hypothetical protein